MVSPSICFEDVKSNSVVGWPPQSPKTEEEGHPVNLETMNLKDLVSLVGVTSLRQGRKSK